MDFLGNRSSGCIQSNLRELLSSWPSLGSPKNQLVHIYVSEAHLKFSGLLTPAGAQVLARFCGHHTLGHCSLPLKRSCLHGFNEIIQLRLFLKLFSSFAISVMLPALENKVPLIFSVSYKKRKNFKPFMHGKPVSMDQCLQWNHGLDSKVAWIE